jgi:hypothetical protein
MDRVEEVGGVADGAGEPEVGGDAEQTLARVGTARSATAGRLDPDQAAAGGRDPDGASPVVAMRDRHGTRRDEGRGPAAGATDAPHPVPGFRVGPCLTPDSGSRS